MYNVASLAKAAIAQVKPRFVDHSGTAMTVPITSVGKPPELAQSRLAEIAARLR